MKKITSSVYTFENLIENQILYIDKTEYIWNLVASAPAMYFLSRPRRFGKNCSRGWLFMTSLMTGNSILSYIWI